MNFTAPAKVNLYLKVIRRREDGYHDIETVFERISIFDEISVDPAEKTTTISCDDPAIPTGADSLMGRAVSAFKERAGIKGHFRIDVKKAIPVAAGMGGGSSDAAAIISGLNQIAGSPLSRNDLVAIAGRLGADIPFFLSGTRFAYGEGRGDIISPLKSSAEIWHVVVNPPFKVATKDIYGKLPAFNLTKEGSVDKMFTAFLRSSDINGISENLRNDLQAIVLRDFPVLGNVLSGLKEKGARGVLLSGSGPAVFGIFDKDRAEEVASAMRKDFTAEAGWRVFVAKTY